MICACCCAAVEAQAAAVAPLMGGASPQEFHAWPADQQAAQLAALPGAAIVASMYHLPTAVGTEAAVTAAGCGVRLGCAVLKLEV